jgi:putative endonuclease
MSHFVYIIYSEKLKRFYTGETPFLKERYHYHNTPELNTNSTRNGIPWVEFLVIEVNTRTIARKIESHIKKQKSAVYIRKLKEHPEWVEKLIERFS